MSKVEGLSSLSAEDLLRGQIIYGLAARVEPDLDKKHDLRIASALCGLEAVKKVLDWIPEEFRQGYLDSLQERGIYR